MPSPIEIILIPTLMIIIGYFLKYVNILKQDDRQTLSDIVIMVTLPCMIFTNIHKANISHDMLLLPIIALLLSFSLVSIAFVYCRIRGYSKKITWTIIIAASMMNTGFMGFPISLGLFGNEGLINAIFFDLSTTIMFILYGILLTKFFGGNRKEVIKSAVTFIPVWAVIFGLIFNVYDISLPYVVENILEYFSQATIPLIMLALGLSLDFKSIGNSMQDSLVVSILKLVIAPVIVSIILVLFNIHGMAFNVGVLEAGMSTAMNALVLSLTYNLDSDLMSSIIFTNVILSLFTLTVIISLIM